MQIILTEEEYNKLRSSKVDTDVEVARLVTLEVKKLRLAIREELLTIGPMDSPIVIRDRIVSMLNGAVQ